MKGTGVCCTFLTTTRTTTTKKKGKSTAFCRFTCSVCSQTSTGCDTQLTSAIRGNFKTLRAPVVVAASPSSPGYSADVTPRVSRTGGDVISPPNKHLFGFSRCRSRPAVRTVYRGTVATNGSSSICDGVSLTKCLKWRVASIVVIFAAALD